MTAAWTLRPDLAGAQRRACIVDALRATGTMSRHEIAERLAISKGQVTRAIKRLATSGLVRALGGGRWEVGS